MGFFDNLWHGVTKLFAKQCPKCHTSNADLQDAQKIIRTLVQQRQEVKTHWEKNSQGQHEQKMQIVWKKDIHYQCQVCGHDWIEQEESLFPD